MARESLSDLKIRRAQYVADLSWLLIDLREASNVATAHIANITLNFWFSALTAMRR